MSLLELFCAVDDFCKGMKKEQVGRCWETEGNDDNALDD